MAYSAVDGAVASVDGEGNVTFLGDNTEAEILVTITMQNDDVVTTKYTISKSA